MQHSRRRYVLWIRAEFIMTLLGNWRFHERIALPYLERCADESGKLFPLPKDVEIIAVSYEWSREAFGLMLTHPSFPEVEDGCRAPCLYYREITVESLPAANVKEHAQAVLASASPNRNALRAAMDRDGEAFFTAEGVLVDPATVDTPPSHGNRRDLL